MALPTDSVNAAFSALCKVTQQRAKELERFEGRNSQNSFDDDKSIENPLYESFLNSIGANGVHIMTNFTISEINRLFNMLKSTIDEVWNKGRGKRCSHSPMDVLLMAITVYKNRGRGTSWHRYLKSNVAFFNAW